jgi:hypothetical protein
MQSSWQQVGACTSLSCASSAADAALLLQTMTSSLLDHLSKVGGVKLNACFVCAALPVLVACRVRQRRGCDLTRCAQATCLLPRAVCVLLFAGCGSVEEVISRDVPRTFPEHPLFNTPAGQQKLLRVLKAYAAADPEVRVTNGSGRCVCRGLLGNCMVAYSVS